MSILPFAAVTLAAATAPVLMIVTEEDNSTEATHEVVWKTEVNEQYILMTSSDMKKWTPTTEDATVGTGDVQREPITVGSETTYYQTKVLGEQLPYIPMPEDGTRYDSYEEFDGPRWPANYGEGHVTLWHDGKFAAYSITIDDNNEPDIPFWLDVSETYGWKITWFVIVYPYVWDIYNNVPGNNTSYFGTMDDWKALHEAGQDVQLHGACSAMNSQTAEEYEDQIIRSIKVMEERTGTKILTFAYPCGKISDPSGTHDYLEIISRYTIGARGGSGGGVSPVHLVNYHTVKNRGVNALVDGELHSQSARYKDKRNFLHSQYRGWIVSLYHRTNSDEQRAQAIETLDWVKAHEDEFWVDTFTDVTKYSQQRESSELEIRSVTPDRIVLNVTDRMDDKLFDHALTVKLRVDGTWGSVSAEQNGDPINSYLVTHEGHTYAYVQPVPDQGITVVTRGD